jgi:hypothetical protein
MVLSRYENAKLEECSATFVQSQSYFAVDAALGEQEAVLNEFPFRREVHSIIKEGRPSVRHELIQVCQRGHESRTHDNGVLPDRGEHELVRQGPNLPSPE